MSAKVSATCDGCGERDCECAQNHAYQVGIAVGLDQAAGALLEEPTP